MKTACSTSVSDTWMPSIMRKKLASLLEIGVAAGQLEDSRAVAATAAAAGYNIRFRVSGPTTADVLELAYSAGTIALLGPIPGNSGLTRALADVGCVHVALAAQILAGDCTSVRSAIDDGFLLHLGPAIAVTARRR